MKNSIIIQIHTLLLILGAASGLVQGAPMGTAFSYQGRLKDGATAANGQYDLSFALYDSATGGNRIGTPINFGNVAVLEGLFTVTLDYGISPFSGEARWLEIGVRASGAGMRPGGNYTILNPRQPVLATPYALYAETTDRVNGNLEISSPATLNFGSSVRQMLNLWSTQYGIGVQANTLYSRSHGGFAWYKDGTHADSTASPGVGGTTLMNLSGVGALEINHTFPGYGLIVNSGVKNAGLFRGKVAVFMDSTIDLPHLSLEETGENDFARLEFQSTTKPAWHIAVGGSANQMNFYNQANGDVMSLTQDGVLWTRVLTITGGADLAEPFPVGDRQINKGSVMIIDEENPGQLKLSERAYDTRVAGIVSGANGIRPGISLCQQGALEGSQNVALSGRVYVQADATPCSIRPGDLLTTSDLPGHAMKVVDHTRAQGAILGKAMSGLTDGRGLVLVLVTLQ